MTNPYAIDADTLSGMRPLRKAVFALGSNLGDRLDNLQGAVDAIKATPDVIIVDISPVYETDPVGGPTDAPQFLNAVVVTETMQPTRTLLERANAVEEAYGRVRENPNDPRTLDVDLIIVGKSVKNDPELTLPHPRAHERAFVLQPWFDVDPIGELPGVGKIADILPTLDASGITRRDDLHLEA